MMRAAFWCAAALAAISLGAAAGPVVWHVLGEVDTGPAVLSAEAAVPVPAASPADLTAILAFAPFGAAAEAAPPPPAEIPATQLGLTLLGLTLATPASASRAIIAGGDVPVESYAVMQAISPAVTLAEVRADHVILLVNGMPEALFFANANTAALLQPTNAVPIIAEGPSDPTNPDAVIAYYRDEVLQNPQALLDRFSLQATPDGYLIGDVSDPDMASAGFQAGDLVTRVNGQVVGDVTRDQAYFDDIAASGRATVEINRAGQTITMTFPLR